MVYPAARLLLRRATAALCFLLPLCACHSAQALERVSVQLKWLHHFQFAGYYAAQEKGFYREAGLDVTIREGGPATEVEDEVTERCDGEHLHFRDRGRLRGVLFRKEEFGESPLAREERDVQSAAYGTQCTVK